MQWLKRIGLFLMVNMLVMVTISLVLNLLGVRGYITAQGIDPMALMIFCLVWGMGGAFISLLLSKFMAKMMMGVRIIDAQTRDPELLSLIERVHHLSRSAGLSTMPEVGVYDSPDLNAFATGPTKASSLVAVSTGLLQRMRTHEVDGVLAHEVAHIANGDMVTMTLIQGIINAFVMFLSRIIAFALSQVGRSRDDNEGGSFSPVMFHVLTFVLEIAFTILGTIVVASFSRWREFRADEGSARIGGRDNMIAALEALKRAYENPTMAAAEARTSQAFQSMQISSRKSGFLSLFATHPSLDERIERLMTLTSV